MDIRFISNIKTLSPISSLQCVCVSKIAVSVSLLTVTTEAYQSGKRLPNANVFAYSAQGEVSRSTLMKTKFTRDFVRIALHKSMCTYQVSLSLQHTHSYIYELEERQFIMLGESALYL